MSFHYKYFDVFSDSICQNLFGTYIHEEIRLLFIQKMFIEHLFYVLY